MNHETRPPERTCHACNQPIRPDERCRGAFGDDDQVRHWHSSCFLAIALAKPEPTRWPRPTSS
jgi:hypothetical protein